MNPSTVYCATCLTPLWRTILLSNGQPVTLPASIEVPDYRDRITQCPFCEQAIYIEKSGYHLTMIRNDEDGHIRVA